jgi:hypothetical protein
MASEAIATSASRSAAAGSPDAIAMADRARARHAHRASWAAASRDLPPDADRQQASMEGLSAGEFPYLSSAADQFMDWSAGADSNRLTIELLVGGLEALAAQPNRGGVPRRVSRE